MKKRLASAALMLAWLAPAWSQPEGDVGRNLHPNIVIFVSDDMGWNDVGYHGSGTKTPNIDRLAEDGVKLDRFYVHPICSPTRTAMMTGRSPARFGITRPLGGNQGVPADEHFMPQGFKAAGYQTFMVGKWHLGAGGDEFSPQQRGFDHFYGFRGGMIDYYTHEGHGGLDWQRNGKTVEENGYSTYLFAAEAVRLLKGRDKSKPVFLYVPFNAPHGPFQAPEELKRKYGGEKSGDRAAAIDAMDQAIGKILNALEDEGMTDSTLAMFFCDNGAGNRERRRSGLRRPQAPVADLGSPTLRGGKGNLYEGGVRVPAVIRWPGVIEPGTTSEQMISVLDLVPTLAAAAGIAHGNAKPLDGINLWPAIREGRRVARKPVVIAGQGGAFALLDDPLKLVHGSEGIELFDVRKDPGETLDLAKSQPDDVARLVESLAPFTSLDVQLARSGGRRSGSSDGGRRRPKRGRASDGEQGHPQAADHSQRRRSRAEPEGEH